MNCNTYGTVTSCEISGSRPREYEGDSLVGYCTTQCLVEDDQSSSTRLHGAVSQQAVIFRCLMFTNKISHVMKLEQLKQEMQEE
jgi:hypothetical protein